MSFFFSDIVTISKFIKNGNFNNLFSYFPAKELPTAFPDLGLTYFKFFLSPEQLSTKNGPALSAVFRS